MPEPLSLTNQLRATEKWIRDMGDQFIDPARTRKLFHDHADRIGKAAEAVEICRLIDELRDGPGHTVEIFCDNEEPPPAVAVEVTAEWTDWESRRYDGNTVLECLQKAIAHKHTCNPQTSKPKP